MTNKIILSLSQGILLAVVLLSSFNAICQPDNKATHQAAKSPWGKGDEIGALNEMKEIDIVSYFKTVKSSKVYDLGVEYFVGMPSFTALNDPAYQFWLTHSPRGTVVGDHTHLGKSMNEKVSYTGDAISMYTHTGTHLDVLNHFGLYGRIWNGYSEAEYLSDKGWLKAGAEKVPPILGRAVLIDVAGSKGLSVLPLNYTITREDLKESLKRTNMSIRKGDIVLIRTGAMQYFYSDREQFLKTTPGISLDAAKWLVEESGAMLLGADNIGLEVLPSPDETNWLPVHTYLLAQKGVMFIELLDLEDLAKDKVYQFLFIAVPLKLRGASAGPVRPIAIPL